MRTRLATLLCLAAMLAMALGPAVALAAPNYSAWNDLGIVYTAPSGNAYYPSVIYDANGFGSGTPLYKMWYSNGSGGVFVVTSTNGILWGSPTTGTGLGDDAHHVQVLYDIHCFGVLLCDTSAAKYRIWYWDIDAALYNIAAMATAQSADGITWTSDTSLTQSVTSQLVTGGGSGWNRGSYGPISLSYQPGALNTGTDPWNYSYVMYYDGVDGSSEVTGLAYSAYGLDWTAYSSSAVLGKGIGNAWDCDDAAFGTVYHNATGYHFWYSGGGGDNGSGGCMAGAPVHEGIGYASSSDGKTWTKASTNPIFHINQGISYRNQRVYAPSVVDDGSGILKMYYSAVGGAPGNDKKIGLATLASGTVFVDDDWASKSPGDVVSGHTFGIDAFDTIQKGINAVLSGGTVYVAAGTYTEVGQIVISKNLNIVGASSATTIIKTAQNTGSAGDPRGWFLINSGSTFNLSQVTLDGTGFKVSIGLLFNGGGNIDHVVFTNIQYDPSTAYDGRGIGVYGTASVVNVTNSTFTQIGRIGIHFRGPGVSGTVSGNRFVGKGVGNWLDYGVEVGAGAHATITNNTFRACLGVVNAQDTSAGILVTTYWGSGTEATITGNTITDSFDGIKVGYDATVDTSTVVAHYNSIVGNGTGIKTSPNTNMVDARYNWWGNASGPGSIGPGTGDKVSVNVNYTPWARALVASTTASTHEVGETGILTTSLTVDGLYGAQLRVTHDATLNWGNGVTITVPTKNWFWQIMTDNFKSVSSPLGIRVAGANQRPEGAANLAGDAIAQWNYTCNTAGTSALTYDTSTGGFGTKLSDINGLEIPAALLGDSITCLAATSAVDGYIGLQGRLKGSVFPTGWLSSTVTLTCTGGTCVGSGPYAMVTNADGYYQRVKTGAGTGIASGTYTAVVTRRGYLPATKTGILVSGGTVTLSAASVPQVPTLLGGDVDGTLGINVNDLSTIGTAFGLVPVGGADTGADVNGDNIVNIFDLVLAGGNYGLSASPTW